MNLQRHIKRRLLAASLKAVVHPAPGCTSSVEAEVSGLLGRLETPGEVRASLNVGTDGIEVSPIRYRSLLELVVRLTTAQDISLVIGEGAVHNRGDLDGLLRRIDWEFFLRAGDAVFLRCDSRASTLYHEGILREAAAEQLAREGVGVVRGAESDQAHTVTLRINRNRCRVLISLAGAPLWKRGYRGSSYASAPLREDIAQSAIRWALEATAARASDGGELPPCDTLFVPFSGSGTLLFEYLVARFAIPPFVFRGGYAFEHFAVQPPSVGWAKGRLLELLAARLSQEPPLAAYLVDRDADAVAAARENLRRFESLLRAAGGGTLRVPLEVGLCGADAFSRPWREWLPDRADRVFLPMNPPYGVRLSTRPAEEVYRRIGRATSDLAAALPRGALSGFLLCPTERSWKGFLTAAQGLEAATTHLSQGGLDIRLCRFRS